LHLPALEFLGDQLPSDRRDILIPGALLAVSRERDLSECIVEHGLERALERDEDLGLGL
jgi:hypothetical protein